jgi:hypothetical protein
VNGECERISKVPVFASWHRRCCILTHVRSFRLGVAHAENGHPQPTPLPSGLRYVRAPDRFRTPLLSVQLSGYVTVADGCVHGFLNFCVGPLRH